MVADIDDGTLGAAGEGDLHAGAGRGVAEEDVLMGCKVSGIGDMQPFDVLDGCNIKEECGPCTFMGRS